MTRWFPLLLTLISIEPAQWSLVWAPHQDNKALVIVTKCDAGTPFQAYNRFDIGANDDRAIVHRIVPPPDSKSCWATGQVMRNEGEDPAMEYTAEWTLVRLDQ